MAMETLDGPVSLQKLRKICRMRTATLCETIAALRDKGCVKQGGDGLSLTTTVSFPDTLIGFSGNGNGKRLEHTS
jgi:hypothetical protein